MNKKIGISFVLILAFFFSFHPSNPVSYASEVCTTEEECEEIIQDTQNRITDLERQESSVQREMTVNESDLVDTLEQIAQTEEAIQGMQTNITALQQDIAELQRNIALKESEIESSQNELAQLDTDIENLKELIMGRMRVTQRMSRNNALLEVLSESENFIDLIRRFRVINHLSQSDSEAMDELRILVEAQQQILATLRTQKAELSNQQAELSNQQAALNVQLEALEAQSATLDSYRAQLEKQQAKLAEQMHEIQADMVSAQESIEIARQQQEIIENTPIPEVIVPPAASTPAPSNPGSPQVVAPPTNQMFIIPLERGRVTCEFTCYAGHTGIDLGNFGDTSTRVLAAAAGVVTRSGWHNMFGNHVMITHNINGQMFTTVYAHLHQTPFVSVGQQVQQGQVLGTMGNTGNSFGAHLHFEIYIGPFNWPHAVNPRQFIHFPSSW